MIKTVTACPNCNSTKIKKRKIKKGYKCNNCKSEFEHPNIRISKSTIPQIHHKVNFIVGENSPLKSNSKFIW